MQRMHVCSAPYNNAAHMQHLLLERGVFDVGAMCRLVCAEGCELLHRDEPAAWRLDMKWGPDKGNRNRSRRLPVSSRMARKFSVG